MDHHSFLHRRDLLRLAGFSSAAWMTGAANVLGEETRPKREPARSIIMRLTMPTPRLTAAGIIAARLMPMGVQ